MSTAIDLTEATRQEMHELVQTIAAMEMSTKEEKKKFIKKLSNIIVNMRHCSLLEDCLQAVYDQPSLRRFFARIVKILPILAGEAVVLRMEDSGKCVVKANPFQSITLEIKLGYVTVTCTDPASLVQGTGAARKKAVKKLLQSWQEQRDALFKAVGGDFDKWIYEQDMPSDPSIGIWHGIERQAKKLIDKGGWKGGRKAAAIQAFLDMVKAQQ